MWGVFGKDNTRNMFVDDSSADPVEFINQFGLGRSGEDASDMANIVADETGIYYLSEDDFWTWHIGKVNSDGDQEWSHTINYTDLDAVYGPVIGEHHIFFGTETSIDTAPIRALDKDNGSVAWDSFVAGGETYGAAAREIMYVGYMDDNIMPPDLIYTSLEDDNASSEVRAITIDEQGNTTNPWADGQFVTAEIQSHWAPNKYAPMCAAIDGEPIFIFGRPGYDGVIGVDAETGDAAWNTATDYFSGSSLSREGAIFGAWNGKYVVMDTNNGVLNGLDPATGSRDLQYSSFEDIGGYWSVDDAGTMYMADNGDVAVLETDGSSVTEVDRHVVQNFSVFYPVLTSSGLIYFHDGQTLIMYDINDRSVIKTADLLGGNTPSDINNMIVMAEEESIYYVNSGDDRYLETDEGSQLWGVGLNIDFSNYAFDGGDSLGTSEVWEQTDQDYVYISGERVVNKDGESSLKISGQDAYTE